MQELLKARADQDAVVQDGKRPLHFACIKGYPDLVRELLVAGADKNPAARDGHTPLHGATAFSHLEVVRELLMAGADENAAKGDGCTALHLAAQGGDIKMTRLLLEFLGFGLVCFYVLFFCCFVSILKQTQPKSSACFSPPESLMCFSSPQLPGLEFIRSRRDTMVPRLCTWPPRQGMWKSCGSWRLRKLHKAVARSEEKGGPPLLAECCDNTHR